MLMGTALSSVSSFTAPFLTSPPQGRMETALGVSFPSSEDFPSEYHPNRRAEFADLAPIQESELRQARREQDEKVSGRFTKYGDDLWNLRTRLEDLSKQLISAINSGVRETEEHLRKQIRALEGKDPEHVYKAELKMMSLAQREGREMDGERHGRKALDARSQLPHYNLDGLWVGK